MITTITVYDYIYRPRGRKVGNKGYCFLPGNYINQDNLLHIENHLEKNYFQSPNTFILVKKK